MLFHFDQHEINGLHSIGLYFLYFMINCIFNKHISLRLNCYYFETLHCYQDKELVKITRLQYYADRSMGRQDDYYVVDMCQPFESVIAMTQQ